MDGGGDPKDGARAVSVMMSSERAGWLPRLGLDDLRCLNAGRGQSVRTSEACVRACGRRRQKSVGLGLLFAFGFA